ncbi:hypothetical protein GGS21DRAFT_224038 [Xylaria nigripes]|nr:hypothetical protein GGS21DRAFT_224038 [Xylaria nigripes]
MAPTTAYILAPDLTFRRDGPIALGNIIADPFNPDVLLATPDGDKPLPPIESITHYNYERESTSVLSVGFSVWAQVLQSLGGSIGTRIEKSKRTRHTMDALETRYFRTQPTEQEIHERVNKPEVREAIRANCLFSRSIYMVVGIKIAKNLITTIERSAQRGANVGAATPTIQGLAALGADIDLMRGGGQRHAFRAGEDVVIAYRLLKIGLKGWKKKTVKARVFKSRSVEYFGAEPEGEESDFEIETLGALTDPFSQIDLDISLKETQVCDGDERCVCISLDDN